MKLVTDWGAILTKAWSIRLTIIAAALSGGEVYLQMIADSTDLPKGVFASLSAAVSALALLARLVAQPTLQKREDVDVVDDPETGTEANTGGEHVVDAS